MIKVTNTDVTVKTDDVVKDLFYLLEALKDMEVDFSKFYEFYKSGELHQIYLNKDKLNFDSKVVKAVYYQGNIEFLN